MQWWFCFIVLFFRGEVLFCVCVCVKELICWVKTLTWLPVFILRTYWAFCIHCFVDPPVVTYSEDLFVALFVCFIVFLFNLAVMNSQERRRSGKELLDAKSIQEENERQRSVVRLIVTLRVYGGVMISFLLVDNWYQEALCALII